MTDKQIIIDGCDVSGCPYYCGHDICKNTCHYFSTPCEWVDVQNCTYKQLKRTESELACKEQECERLKLDLIEAKAHGDYLNNSALSETLKIVSEQCDQFKKANDEKNELLAKLGCPTIATARMKAFTLQQQLEAYKMEAEEGKEINAELKAENDDLKKYKDVVDKLAGMQVILTNEEKMPMLYENAKDLKLKQLSETLEEIKSLCYEQDLNEDFFACEVLQKISEVENEGN